MRMKTYKTKAPVSISGTRVAVGDKPRDFERALRIFNRKVADANILNDLRKHEFYEKPSITKRRNKKAAIKRWQKQLQDEQQTELNLNDIKE